MRTVHSFAVFGLLVGVFATTSCGGDDTTGSGGAGGSSSSSGAPSGSTTTSRSSASATASASSSGAGGGSVDPGEQCPGCARLSVPLSQAGQLTQFFIEYDQPVDLTGATVTFRVKAHSGSAGGLQPFVQNGAELFWANIGYTWNKIVDLGEWTELTIDVDQLAPAFPFFDRTVVKLIGLQISSGDDKGPYTDPETVIYVDSITVTRPRSTSGAEDTSGQRSAGSRSGERGAGAPSGERGDGGAGGAGGESGAGGAGGTTGAGGESGAGGAEGTTGAGGAGGAGGTMGEGGAGGAGGTMGEGGAGGAGGTMGEGGAGGAGGTMGEGGAGGSSSGSSTSSSSTSSSTTTAASSSSSTGAGGGEGGAGGGEPVDVIHVLGPYEFTTSAEPMKMGDYMTVIGSKLLHIPE